MLYLRLSIGSWLRVIPSSCSYPDIRVLASPPSLTSCTRRLFRQAACSPLANSTSDGVPTRNAKSGAVAELRATGRARKEEIRRPGSSGNSCGKKTPLNSVPAAPTATSLSSGALVAAYEELRRQVLLNRHGPGAAVLMRRGVWAWISVCSAGSAALPTKTFTQSEQSEADRIIPQGLHTEIVVMLAGMLLGRYQEASA